MSNKSLQSVESNSSKILPPVSFQQPKQPIQEIAYKFIDYPDFQQNKQLQSIIDDVVNFARNKNLSTEEISISLIDVNKGEIAGYQENKLRFPASVAKLFWMVALYGQFESSILQEPGMFDGDLDKMIQESDNEATSRIIDYITDTRSGSELKGIQYQNWLYKRTWINRFFKKQVIKELISAIKLFQFLQR
ncbi:MAG: serine hydrolase [Hydrococcus sp. CRU_1_1]|nr:serine hydrolase [Hydrococcus sp. CRU_1_1]